MSVGWDLGDIVRAIDGLQGSSSLANGLDDISGELHGINESLTDIAASLRVLADKAEQPIHVPPAERTPPPVALVRKPLKRKKK